MPLIYRAMQGASDGPVIGHTANDTLGCTFRKYLTRIYKRLSLVVILLPG
jgi:hypothetical protein